MNFTRLRDKLLLGAIAISLVVTLASMLGVTWVVRKQALEQSNALLHKAAILIEDSLAERESKLLAASHQLAVQKNLGSTLWYLSQYAQRQTDPETLFNSYQQLVRDATRASHAAGASRVALYNSAGKLVSFVALDGSARQVGLITGFGAPQLRLATLGPGEDLTRKDLRPANPVDGISLSLDGPLPQREEAHYAVVDGKLVIESYAPIMGEAFDPRSGREQTRQLGLVVMVQPVDQPFIERLARLTDTRIDILTTQAPEAPSASNVVTLSGEDYYRRLIPLYAGEQRAGTLAVLYSMENARKNTWQMIQTLALIAAGSLLLILPVAWYFAVSISRPITVLSRVFRGVAGGQQSPSGLGETGLLDKGAQRRDELGDLTRSFIAMHNAVEQKIQQIRELNASLEQKVRERTAALAASERESRTLIENTPDTIARYDRDCRRLFVNPAFAAVAEGGAAALLGKKPSEVPGGGNSMIYENHIREVLASGKNTQFELHWPGKDGVEICSHIRLTPEFDLEGNIVSVLGIGRDITELNQSRTELKQAKQELNNLLAFNRTIVESSPAGIAVYRKEGPCIMSNEAYARTIGTTVEEMLQQDFRNSESWKRNGLLDLANRAFATGSFIQKDIQGITTYGKHAALNCIFAPVDIAGENHLLLITNDVSERVAAEQALTESMRQLEEKELAKTRFLAAAGHDLRQPLAAANLYIDALKFIGLNGRQIQVVHRLEEAMTTFNGLLDALLNISKLDAGIIKPECAPININELMNWLDQNFSLLAASKKLSFRLHFPMREPLAIYSDIGLVKSVLMNLVSNAMKFTPEGTILVSARRRGDRVLFQVWDTGLGIKEEHLALIFDEFFQVDNPQRDRSSGLGLGLSITKRALQLLGGKISCRSQPGRGTVFSFYLPVYEAPGKNAPLAELATQGSAASNVAGFVRNRRFILVEDDKLVSQAMASMLEGMGGEVRCFHRAEDALQHPLAGEADCYIVDYMLGGATQGDQFLSQLRQQLGRPLVAVLITGDTSAATLRYAAEFPWPVLHKPVSASQLIASLREQTTF